AVFGCTTALAISVRATKTHEVLMAVYGIETLWVLGPLLWALLAMVGGFRAAPAWFVGINPFVMAWAPYAWPDQVGWWQMAAVLGGTLALSAGFAAYAVLRLRAEARDRSGSRMTRLSAWLG